MKRLRIQAFAVAVLMAVGSYAGTHLRPSAKLADQRPKISLENLFPKSFSGWSVDTNMPAQLISPDTAELLNKIYNETLSRTYVNQRGDRIMVSVAYGGDQSDGTRAHRPEVCYPAQGFQLLSTVDGVVSLKGGDLPVRRLVTQLGGRHEPLTYWMVVGDRIALSGTQQKMAQLAYSVHGVIPDGMLVRVSNISGEPKAAFELQNGFIRQLFEALPRDMADRIFGQQGGLAEVAAAPQVNTNAAQR